MFKNFLEDMDNVELSDDSILNGLDCSMNGENQSTNDTEHELLNKSLSHLSSLPITSNKINDNTTSCLETCNNYNSLVTPDTIMGTNFNIIPGTALLPRDSMTQTTTTVHDVQKSEQFNQQSVLLQTQSINNFRGDNLEVNSRGSTCVLTNNANNSTKIPVAVTPTPMNRLTFNATTTNGMGSVICATPTTPTIPTSPTTLATAAIAALESNTATSAANSLNNSSNFVFQNTTISNVNGSPSMEKSFPFSSNNHHHQHHHQQQQPQLPQFVKKVTPLTPQGLAMPNIGTVLTTTPTMIKNNTNLQQPQNHNIVHTHILPQANLKVSIISIGLNSKNKKLLL